MQHLFEVIAVLANIAKLLSYTGVVSIYQALL